jgi:hypothetical protein
MIHARYAAAHSSTQTEFPEVDQPWHADDAAEAAAFSRSLAMFKCLLELGPGYGYHPESSKSIVVVTRHNLERAKVYFADLALKVQTGSRYFRGFVGEHKDRDEWLESKILTLVDIINQLTIIMGPYPQPGHAGLQKSVQAELTFVQRVVRDVGNTFDTIREAMNMSFLPSLMKETL